MITAISGYRNNTCLVSGNDKKNSVPQFGSTPTVVQHPYVIEELSKLRLSMNEESMALLRKVANQINEMVSSANTDGKKDLVEINLKRLGGVVGERESLTTSNPSLAGYLTRTTKDGKPVSIEDFSIDFKK